MMERLFKLVEGVVSAAQIGVNPAWTGQEQPHKRFGAGSKDSVSFIGSEVLRCFDECVHELWGYDKSISQTVSLKAVENALVELARRLHMASSQLKASDLDDLFLELGKPPVEEWTALRQVYGVRLQSPSPVVLGQYIVLSWKNHRSEVESIAGDSSERLWKPDENGVYVTVKVNARDRDRAEQLADGLFRRFESLMGFVIADPSGHCDVGVLTYRGPQKHKLVLRTAKSRGVSGRLSGAVDSVPIDDPFLNSTPGFKWLWDLALNPTRNEISRRLLRAIDWFGRAIRDPDIEDSFVQFFFGIETLLKTEENSVISPSVTAQICEYAAFVLATTPERRMNIDAKMRMLYKKRSALAHGGIGEIISDLDQFSAGGLLKSLISVFALQPEISKMNKMAELRDWVREKKFA